MAKSFTEATAAKPLGGNAYSITLSPEYCIGSVPNGGYTASCLLRIASVHLASRNQPDTLTAHFEYIGRAEEGPAIVIVEEVKLGRAISTLHLTLYQHDLQPNAPWITPRSRKNVLGYVQNTKLSLQEGLSLTTGWELTPAPPPADLSSLAKNGEDGTWKQVKLTGRGASFRRAILNLEMYAPNRAVRRGVEDRWMRFVDGTKFKGPSLGFVVDIYPIVVEAWRPRGAEAESTTAPFRRDELFWYPTLVLNLDVKRELPAEGVEWLFMRCYAKEIRNGRLDLEVVVLDERGRLVALSTHVCLIMPAARNLQARSHKEEKL